MTKDNRVIEVGAAPFDVGLLDRLMEENGIDVLVATSKHAVQYLMGGHRFFFYEFMDAVALSRYLPVFVYFKGHPEKSAYFGHEMEKFVDEIGPFWTRELNLKAWGVEDVVSSVVLHIQSIDLPATRIGVELGFMPAIGMTVLREGLPDAGILDAVFVLERLRARKSPVELAQLKLASERVVESMLHALSLSGEGTSKLEIARQLRNAEVSRDLNFDYCLIAMGTNFNRSPFDQRWARGETLSLDSGGNYQGYIGDVARMAILGEPDGELIDLLGHVDEIQMKARSVVRPGALGREIYDAIDHLATRSPHADNLRFCAHGMGLITHEAPRLSITGPVPYEAPDRDLPLETGMVISIETTLLHAKRGYIKLEDTIAVTEHGHEGYGDGGRGWNIVG